MTTSPIDKLCTKLYQVTGYKPSLTSSGFKAKCPAHQDNSPSLSISEADDRILICCHTGCETEDIVRHLNMQMNELFDDSVDIDKTPSHQPQKRVSSAVKNKKSFPTLQDAINNLKSKPSEVWHYHNESGVVVGAVVRFDKAKGGKHIFQISLVGDSWQCAAMPTPRPLYNLPKVLKADTVCVCEGEKAADALAELGYVVTTSAGGSNAAKQANWSTLAAKSILIFPDNDEAGGKYADKVCELLSSCSPAPQVKIVTIPDLPDKGDAFDFIELRRQSDQSDDDIRAEIDSHIEAAEVVEVEDQTPEPQSQVAMWKPFPTDVLPEPLNRFIVQSSKATGIDEAFFTTILIGLLAGVIGNQRRLYVKKGWTEPCVLWMALIGKSGSGKTPAQSRVMTYVKAIEDRYRNEHKIEVEQHEKSKEASTSDDSCPPPVLKQITTKDSTIEGLAKRLKLNPSGLIFERDELAGIIKGEGQYKSGRGGDTETYLEMADAGELKQDRKSAESIYVKYAAVSIIGGIQPKVIHEVFTSDRVDNGYVQRFLMVYPPDHSIRWTDNDIPDELDKEMQELFDSLSALGMSEDDYGEPEPVMLYMDSAAKNVYISAFNKLQALRDNTHDDYLAAVISKMDRFIKRFAIIIHCVKEAAGIVEVGTKVNRETMQSAERMMWWFYSESTRLYHQRSEEKEDTEIRELIEWIRDKHGGKISVRNLQNGKRKYKQRKELAESALQGLVDRKYGKWEYTPPPEGGGSQSKVFILSTVDTRPVYGVENAANVDVDANSEGGEVL